MAHAESSSGAVYEPEVPSVKSEPHGSNHSGTSATKHKSETQGKAEGSAVKGNGASEGAGGESEGQKSAGVSSNGGSKNPPTGGGAEGAGGHAKGAAEGSIAGAQEVPGSAMGSNASHASGGSSPVVPILIAVAVLAAISIGVVLYRQRRSGQDGSDGRVSSSNAS